MEVLVAPIFRILISEGLKAIFNPLRERLYKYYKIKTLTRSILKRITIYITSDDYDFEGYLEILINSDILADISDPNNLESIKNVFKTKFFLKLDGHHIMGILKKKVKQDNYLSMEFLKEKLTLEFFFDLFGDPKLNDAGNEKKKKVIESIWKAFNVEALKVVQTKDVIIEMYIGLQGDMEEIKKFMRSYIETQIIEDEDDYKYKEKLIYNKLWHLLVDLQFAADELWENATEKGIRNFITIYKEVFKEIKKNRYTLHPPHREKLVEILHQFELYYDGKRLFVDTKRAWEENGRHEDEHWKKRGRIYETDNRVTIHKDVLEPIIENNRKIREQYLKLLSEISDYFDDWLMKA